MLTSSRYARAVVCKFFLCIHASYFMPKYDEVNFEEIRRGEIRNWAEKHIFISSKHFDKSRACAVMHAYLHMYILWLAEKVSPSQEGIFIHIYLREIPTLKRTKHIPRHKRTRSKVTPKLVYRQDKRDTQNEYLHNRKREKDTHIRTRDIYAVKNIWARIETRMYTLKK